MEKIYKYFKKNPFVLLLILILVFFTPNSLFSPGENRERAIVIALGLDKVDDQFELSLLTFIPTPNQEFKQTNSVVSGKGNSISQAIFDAQLTLGKEIGLSHAKTTIVSQSMLNEDISSSLDYLSRVASLPENTIFICTNSSAKDLLKATNSLEENLGLKLDQLVSYNANDVYVTDTSLEAFYQGYYSVEKSSLIGYIEYVKEDENSASQNSGGETSQSEGNASGENTSQNDGEKTTLQQEQTSQNNNEKERGSINGQSQILNKGQAVLLRKGKMVAKLDINDLNSINLLDNKEVLQSIKIKDVNVEDNKIVDMVFVIKNKNVTINTYFQNDYPIFVADVNLNLKLSEIDTKGQEIKSNTQFTEISSQISKKIETDIKEQFYKTLKILRENKTDIINVYDTFFRQNRKQFEKFYNNLNDKEDYLNNITFMLNLRILSDG